MRNQLPLAPLRLRFIGCLVGRDLFITFSVVESLLMCSCGGTRRYQLGFLVEQLQSGSFWS
ncbi:hypothetical protein Goarm_018724 [Gossypium armourianum]|uniref:Uncharacterized protein n=1 Tax=Gossypium armourianum TaxID=34283 RepID=A0A7J9IIF4_9ROSI|nr:hypothetical protein [Gossypium armourianum]